MDYTPDKTRYENMVYNRSGKSGVLLPAVSLGLWHNFGGVNNYSNAKDIIRTAFDRGITHFDLANNYGPPYGSAEETFGRILKEDFHHHRDELFISSKAGFDMWDGPYGNWGSRKYLMASLDQSLKRMGLDYVDVFYHHRPDPETPLEETMQALTDIVRSGKALYAAISNYPAEQAAKAFEILKENKTPCLLHQAKYNMFVRWVEEDLLDAVEAHGVGCIVFSPLAEGLLTNKYITGIPEGSRASKNYGHLQKEWITEERIKKVIKLNELATSRDQSLAQMALAWLLKDHRVTSVLIGASSVSQLEDNLAALNNLSFSADELELIESVLDNKNEYSKNL
ncbi:L-glyceraldehyde 3-phosphate reductase [Saccharicrinis sp. FJH62]|uniref:L-glyceraldehyde 3-phosphate reductase n=1 Tax=Saccharicrinis sp. FJH62 TaxID=3344657 RepID=UPI0035D41D5D